MAERKFKCMACGEILGYGVHCPNSHDRHGRLTEDHHEVTKKLGHLYEEITQ